MNHSGAVRSYIDNFVKTHPYHDWIALIKNRTASIANVISSLDAIVTSGGSFSLIRAGDGEGLWLSANEDELQYIEILNRGRKFFCDRWFYDGSFETDILKSTQSRLHFGLLCADLLGVPGHKLISHSMTIQNINTIGILRSLRMASVAAGLNRNLKFCDLSVNHNIVRSDLFWNFLGKVGSINLIAPHDQLPNLLRKSKGINVKIFFKIPSSRHNESSLPASSRSGDHYPDRFLEIIKSINESRSGPSEVWLVAAGMLGKIYCDNIKQNGGIAIDIGSVVDGWIGVKTRPGVDINQTKL